MYHWELSSYVKRAHGQFLHYSSKYGLISIGDYHSSNNLTVLKFHDYNNDNWKWQNIDTEWKSRCWMSAAMITNDMLICCGGHYYRKYVDVYNFKTKKMKKLASMNEERRFSGIFVDDINNQKVYVGGGFDNDSSKKFEFYDIKKNKWICLCDTNGNHKLWPIIWSDEPNIINIASTSQCKMIEKIDIRENKWNNLYVEDFDDLFGLKINIDQTGNRLLFDNRTIV